MIKHWMSWILNKKEYPISLASTIMHLSHQYFCCEEYGKSQSKRWAHIFGSTMIKMLYPWKNFIRIPLVHPFCFVKFIASTNTMEVVGLSQYSYRVWYSHRTYSSVRKSKWKIYNSLIVPLMISELDRDRDQ